jgi:hypothetical protein
MDEYVFIALVGRDEPETLRVAEPLHGSSCHKKHLPYLSRTGKEGAAAQPNSL